MQKPKALPNEIERQKALDSYNLLNTESEEIFDSITKLASSICKTPIALISLIDRDRQWFKSKIGLDAPETPRDISFCGHAIHGTELFIVKDATRDERFFDNPLVTAKPDVIFYAGKPLHDSNGMALGTLCVIDHVARDLSDEQKSQLELIGKQVIQIIEMRKDALEKKKAFTLLAKLSENMPGFNYTYKVSKSGHASFPYASKQITNIYEYTPEEVKDNAAIVLGRIHPDDLSLVLESINKSASDVTPWECEYRVHLPKAKERWLRGNANPELTPEGDLLWYGFITDITDFKMQQEVIFKSAKMSSLGEMAAGIAHEINNPLTIIKTSAQQIKNQITREDFADKENSKKFQKYVEKINNTTDRIAKIVKALKFFTSPTNNMELSREPLKIILEDTLALCHERFQIHGIPLDVKYPKDISHIFVDCRSVEISQVLLNLLNNAFDAVESLNEKWVSIEIIPNDKTIQILVIDSGKGIDEELASKIMMPFFTTKSAGKGTGLGLSIIQQLLNSHGGKLTIDFSHPHTCFIVTLPIVQL